MFLSVAQIALWTRTKNKGGAEIRSVWYGFFQCLRYGVQKFTISKIWIFMSLDPASKKKFSGCTKTLLCKTLPFAVAGRARSSYSQTHVSLDAFWDFWIFCNSGYQVKSSEGGKKKRERGREEKRERGRRRKKKGRRRKSVLLSVQLFVFRR